MQSNYIVPLSIATERAMTLLQYRTLRRRCYRACYIALLLTDFRFQKTMLAVMLQSAPIDKLIPTSCSGIARNPHKCGKELLLQSTVRSGAAFNYHRNCIASHAWRSYREHPLQWRSHSSTTTTPMRLLSDCIATERATWLRYWPELVLHHRCSEQKQTFV